VALSLSPRAQAAGNVQILHFKMRRQGYDMVNPWYHAGVYMLDSDNACLMGWQGGSAYMRPQLNLPTTGNTVSPEGASNEFASPAPTAYRVRVCSTDNPTDPDSQVWDSGVITGSATSKVTGVLPTDQHLWAFVNEQYAGWTGWSLQGQRRVLLCHLGSHNADGQHTGRSRRHGRWGQAVSDLLGRCLSQSVQSQDNYGQRGLGPSLAP